MPMMCHRSACLDKKCLSSSKSSIKYMVTNKLNNNNLRKKDHLPTRLCQDGIVRQKLFYASLNTMLVLTCGASVAF